MNAIQRAWRGEERLWKVWWLWGYGPAFALYVWVRTVVFGLYRAAPGGVHGDAVFAYLLGGVSVTVFIGVTTWRCAFNVEWRQWGYFARVATVIGICYVAAVIPHNLALLQDDPAAWAIETGTSPSSLDAGQPSEPAIVQMPQNIPAPASEVVAPAPTVPTQPDVTPNLVFPEKKVAPRAPAPVVPAQPIQRALPPLLSPPTPAPQSAQESGEVGEIAYRHVGNEPSLKLTDQVGACRGGHYFWEDAADGLSSRDGCWAACGSVIVIEYRGGYTVQYPVESFVAVSDVFSTFTQ
ncbi:hypothetical protein AB4Y40_41650 [Paraburkholderia sp. EG287B]|uniref:hypothetical protein n=1 Tax=unclassified Paraburkholderia TaxID=2615204 RepID=UPI0034D34C51